MSLKPVFCRALVHKAQRTPVPATDYPGSHGGSQMPTSESPLLPLQPPPSHTVSGRSAGVISASREKKNSSRAAGARRGPGPGSARARVQARVPTSWASAFGPLPLGPGSSQGRTASLCKPNPVRPATPTGLPLASPFPRLPPGARGAPVGAARGPACSSPAAAVPVAHVGVLRAGRGRPSALPEAGGGQGARGRRWRGAGEEAGSPGGKGAATALGKGAAHGFA